MERAVKAYVQIVLLLPMGIASCVARAGPPPQAGGKKLVRICTAQPATQNINWRLKPQEALAAANTTLGRLENLVHRAGGAGCDVLALPEDTLGTLHWELGNKRLIQQVLPEAVSLASIRAAKQSKMEPH